MLPSPHLEVWVEHPVGEATHADPDALEHTVASQLVHDQGRLHLVVVVINMVMVNMVNKTFRNMTKKRQLLCYMYLARLLVCVRHKATDKVRLAVVQGAHQLGEGDLRCKVDIDVQHESS